MWNPKRLPEQEEQAPGVFSRLKDAFAATKGLIGTRVEIFREEVSEKGSLAGRGATALGIALVVGWLAMLLFTALVAGAGAAAFVGIKSLKQLNPFHFPATTKGLKEDWAAIRESVRPPPPTEEDEDDLEARFRAGSE